MTEQPEQIDAPAALKNAVNSLLVATHSSEERLKTALLNRNQFVCAAPDATARERVKQHSSNGFDEATL
jgi:hypothetical protein